jgi:ABC-2 type transport system permease protein
MRQLIKYELLRRKNLLLLALATIVFVQLSMLFTLYKGGYWLNFSLVLAIVFPLSMYLIIIVDGIVNYSQDLNQKTGYMLFMTPRSGYKIIGSKFIVLALEAFFSVLIVIGFLFINYHLAQYFYFNELDAVTQDMIRSFSTSFNNFIPKIYHIVLIAVVAMLQIFTFITVVFAAITLRKTLLSNAPFKGFFSFLFFIILNTANQFFSFAVLMLFGYLGDVIDMSTMGNELMNFDYWGFMTKYLLIGTACYLLFISIYSYLSGMLLQKRIDL